MLTRRSVRMAPGMLVALLIALVGSGWLLASRLLAGTVLDLAGFGGWLGFGLLALPAFAVACLWSGVYLLCALGDEPWGRAPRSRPGWRHALLPLAVNAVALVVCRLAPLGDAADALDFRLHEAARTEIVQRVAAGELRPLLSAGANLPLVALDEYPWAVSLWGDERRVGVYRADGALHVAFFGARRDHDTWSAFVYRSDGRPPALPRAYWPGARGSAPLADHWYRVVSSTTAHAAGMHD